MKGSVRTAGDSPGLLAVALLVAFGLGAAAVLGALRGGIGGGLGESAVLAQVGGLSVLSDSVCVVRYFNTAGPCAPMLHYMLPAQERLPRARGYIEQGQYFVVHAPRQTGKTTALAAMARDLTASGRYAALHFSCESAEPAGEDVEHAEQLVLSAIRRAAEAAGLSDELVPPNPWPDDVPGARLTRGLMDTTRSHKLFRIRRARRFFHACDGLLRFSGTGLFKRICGG